MQEMSSIGVLSLERQKMPLHSQERSSESSWWEVKASRKRSRRAIGADPNVANIERLLARMVSQHPESPCSYVTVWADNRATGSLEFLMDYPVASLASKDELLPPLPLPISLLQQIKDRLRWERGASPVVFHDQNRFSRRRSSSVGSVKEIQEWLTQQGWKTVLVLPVTDEKQNGGFIAFYSREVVLYRDADLESLQYMADILFTMLWMTRDVQTLEMTTRIDEQRRIARNLHDTTVQDATGTILELENASLLLAATLNGENQSLADATEAHQHILQALELTRKLAGSLREKMWDLHATSTSLGEPLSALSPEQFKQGVNSIAERILMRVSCPLAFRIMVMGDEKPLQRAVSDEIFYILTEALNNIVRHANATQVSIAIVFCGPLLRISVSDNGRGIDPSRLEQKRKETPGNGGFGLMGMAERVKLLNGSLAISGAPDRGTILRVTVSNEAV